MPNIQKLIFNDNVLDVSNISSDGFASGTKILFYQNSAPTGWTIDTSANDCGVRIVSSSGGTISGSTAFSSIFGRAVNTSATSVTISGNTGNRQLTVAMLARHNHSGSAVKFADYTDDSATKLYYAGEYGGAYLNDKTFNVNPTGGNGTHNHTFSGSSSHSHNITLNLKYINVIVCSKN